MSKLKKIRDSIFTTSAPVEQWLMRQRFSLINCYAWDQTPRVHTSQVTSVASLNPTTAVVLRYGRAGERPQGAMGPPRDGVPAVVS